MAISDKSMKILWALSGGCCAICRTALVIPREVEADDHSAIGEMAHIHPQSPGGPRGNVPFTGNRDHHSNLVLLCGNHHKVVDDQENGWPVERMKKLKADHETWVASTLTRRPLSIHIDPSGPDPKTAQFFMVRSGAELWDLISTAWSFLPSYSEENRTDEEVEQLLALLDELKDWLDLGDALETLIEQRNARKRMDEILEKCADIGYFLYSRKIKIRTTGGVDPSPMTWWQAEVRAVPVEHFFKLVEDRLKQQDDASEFNN
ncbi:HNH endonuclease [Streptomyces sp. MN12]